jgi:hypothetical protein
MNETLTYWIGPVNHPSSVIAGRQQPSGPWFDVSGPAQRQSHELAARVAMLERRLEALEALAAAAE